MRALRLAERLLEAMVAFLLFALVAMVFTNVMMRFFFNSGIVVTEELSRIALSILILTGAVMLYGNFLLAQGAWMQAKLNFSSNYQISGLPSATIYVAATLAGTALALVVAGRMVLILSGRMPADKFFQAASADIAE